MTKENARTGNPSQSQFAFKRTAGSSTFTRESFMRDLTKVTQRKDAPPKPDAPRKA